MEDSAESQLVQGGWLFGSHENYIAKWGLDGTHLQGTHAVAARLKLWPTGSPARPFSQPDSEPCHAPTSLPKGSVPSGAFIDDGDWDPHQLIGDIYMACLVQ